MPKNELLPVAPGEFCKGCGKPLYRMKWNSAGDILVCDNPVCKRFRNPLELPYYLTRRREVNFETDSEDKVRRLRDSILAEKEDPEILHW